MGIRQLIRNFFKGKKGQEEKQNQIATNKEVYTQNEEDFHTCINVYGFQTEVSDFWLKPIMNIPNAIVKMDIISDGRKVVVEALNNFLAEENVRPMDTKDYVEWIESELQDIESLYQQVRNGGIVKFLQLRIYISAGTMNEIEKQAKEVTEALASINFKGKIFLT
ncbi:hypothetical protein [Bacillus thuringiensis]|uniref:Uncharacterized protein n=1 Tax=Bacillus thuringiensis serovar toumanoffi TaxID=180862 RepID=A0ABD5IAC8_BACTU|nr:hypothetical protein [Bacillus thuringiensis]MCR6784327.1 hypothetical protein [Bacillus thuringiensis]MCR6863139.1 hypothetical protein [Bacillus thuringiensis]MCR6869252.1 hypothetical protein [Bacillus thuringiensis]MDW9213998.1 hypothetical protein [Bacillus thuringiensis serovar toumanoffi]MED2618462.1 hypothetical protein [Bacillus thuringiensis]